MRCITCKWYETENWHMCQCPKMVYGYGSSTKRDPDGLSIEDDEGWGMIPGPAFGCIHHEEK